MTDPVTIKFAAMIETALARDYVAAMGYLRWLDGADGQWKYRHQNANAIKRLKDVFRNTFDCDPWPPDKDFPLLLRLQYENEVGHYIHRLGVAVLIDDMRQVKTAGLTPRTLLYFLRSSNKHGEAQSSRWELLLYAKMEEEWQEAKRLEAKEAERAARRIGYKPKAVVPAWVIEGRKTLAAIKAKPNPTLEERRTVAKLENTLSRLRYNHAS